MPSPCVEESSAETFHSLGLLAWSQRDFTWARQFFEKALRTFEQLSDRQGIARCRNSLGLIARTLGDNASACSRTPKASWRPGRRI